jgi:hypothetical protein
MSLTGFLNNIDITPDNWQELKLVKDFSDRRAGVSVEVDGFKLVREGCDAMIKWLYEQQGFSENPPATYTSPSGKIYNMFIDNRTLDIGLDDIAAELKMRKDNAHFFDRMDVLSFDLLRKEGFITDDMLVDFPFLIVPDDLKQQKAIQLATLAALLFQLYITIKEAADTAALLSNPTNLPVFIIQAASLALFIALTVSALVQTAINLQELFFPFIRYYRCISDYDLMKAACAREGYVFTSDFMANERAGVHSIGRPESVEESITDKLDNFFVNTYHNKGYPRSIDTGGNTPGALFDEYLKNYDIELFIFEGNVRMERSSFFNTTDNVNVKPTLSDQSNNDDRYSLNFREVWGRKYYRWSNDENDVHSKEVNKGDVRFEAITTQINTINKDLVNLTGFDPYVSPYALVKRKNDFTGVELFVQEIITLIESNISDIAQQLGQNNNFNISSLISKRLGVGVFERNYWTVTRKVWGVPEIIDGRKVLRQPENFLDFLSQTKINEIFNTGLYVKNNLFRIKQITVKSTDENFVNLLQNNRVNYEGEDDAVRVWRVEWYPYKYEWVLKVELPDESGFNTQTEIL